MTTYSIRVELHDATWEHYYALHEKLNKIGVVTHITADDGKNYKLPPAEYAADTNADAQTVLNAVYGVAEGVRKNPAVFVTKSAGRMWQGLQQL
ncbi:hypothetical protein [Duganella sp. Dugasp56]|uniref:hypothetical protein n=1 Tax=Duganella sp. Dugasp56 TaxID=3243046 RepID=UPI0039AF5427